MDEPNRNRMAIGMHGPWPMTVDGQPARVIVDAFGRRSTIMWNRTDQQWSNAEDSMNLSRNVGLSFDSGFESNRNSAKAQCQRAAIAIPAVRLTAVQAECDDAIRSQMTQQANRNDRSLQTMDLTTPNGSVDPSRAYGWDPSVQWAQLPEVDHLQLAQQNRSMSRADEWVTHIVTQ